MEVAVFQEVLADALLYAVAGKGTVGQNNAGAAALAQIAYHYKQEKVGAFGGAEGLRIICFHSLL